MGQRQSKTTKDQQDDHEIGTTDDEVGTDDELVTCTDEEHGGTEIITVSRVKATSAKEEEESANNRKPCLPLSKFMMFVVITVLAAIVAGITAPLVVASLKKKERPDPGANVNYNGETPTTTRPIQEEDVGALPRDSTQEEEDTAPPTTDVEFPDKDGSALEEEEVEEQGSDSTEEATDSASNLLPTLPFEDVELPFFTPEVMEGYTNRTEFEHALTEAAKFLVNKVVLQHLGFTSPPLLSDNNNVNGFTWRGSTQGEQPQGFHDATDYETNNQEQGVDEADLMKADANYVYAAYSNYVLVWDTDGNQVAQAKMPTSTDDNDSSQQSQSSGGFGIFSSSAFGTFSGHKAHVESLLLVDDTLVVIVSGYGSQESGEKTALMNYKGTQVRTYKTTNVATNGELTLVGTKDLNGRFVDARSIGSQVHIATISGIDTHTYLTAPLNRFVNFPDLSDEEYVKRVRTLALDKFIPSFVEKLSNELLYRDHHQNEVLPNMLQLNQWQSQGDDSEGRAMVEAGMFQTGVINSATLITSLDVRAAPMVDPSQLSHELIATTSAYLAPSYQTHVYSTASKLVLATRAWNWNSETAASEEVTHLVVLSIDEQDDNADVVTTSFHALGTVRGYLLNPYSLDIEGNDLRAATTISRRWRFRGMPQLSSNAAYVGDHGTGKITVMDRNADQEDSSVVEDSITENYITVFDLDSNSMLKERGSVQLGEKDELITAVRFFKDVAYCVTFVQTDPFYVVDLKEIETLGSFKLNGFSNYLHPLNDDHTLILGIGQNATDEGTATGFMITVFDATDPTNPKAIESYTVDDSPEGTVEGQAIQSTAQWDYKSFRYVDGKLIVPLDIVTYSTEGSTADAIRQTVLGSFEGFVVFNIAPDSISEHFRISHSTLACHYCGYLAPRSFVYDGNVLTAEGNIVSSTSLNTKYERWAFHVKVEGEEARCCY